jgi:hypothetical protein
MQARNLTPEERLLRLIESGEQGPRRFVFSDVRTWPTLLLSFTEYAKRLTRVRFAGGLAPRELNLKLINWGLAVLLVAVGATIALNMNRIRPGLTDLSGRGAVARASAGAEQTVASLRPPEDYLAEVEKRDIFNPPPPPKPEAPAPKAASATPPPATPPAPNPLDVLKDRAKTLKLVGIAWGAAPVAMIEDTAKRETAFLKVGHVINDMKIKAILKDRVVLTYGNAEHDLF